MPVVANAYILSAPGGPRLQRRQGARAAWSPTTCSRSSEREAAAPDKGRAFFLEFAAKQLVVSARAWAIKGIYICRAPRRGRGGPGPRAGRRARRRTTGARCVQGRPLRPAGRLPAVRERRRRAWPPTSSARPRRRSLTPAGAQPRARRGVDPSTRSTGCVHERVFDAGDAGLRRVDSGSTRPSSGTTWASRSTCWSRRSRCRCSTAATAATARCPTSPTCAPRASARRTSATAPAAAPATGMCEVPGNTCVWADAYRRLKPYGEELTMLERPVVVQDNALRRTSAWAQHVPRARPLRRAPGRGRRGDAAARRSATAPRATAPEKGPHA